MGCTNSKSVDVVEDPQEKKSEEKKISKVKVSKEKVKEKLPPPVEGDDVKKQEIEEKKEYEKPRREYLFCNLTLSDFKIPEELEGFNVDLIQKLLHTYPKMESVDFSSPGTTQLMGDTRHMQIFYDLSIHSGRTFPNKLILKFSGPNSARSRSYNNYRGIYDLNEHRILTDMLKGKNFKIPDVYFSHLEENPIEDEGGKGFTYRILLLEEEYDGDTIDCREKFVGIECAKDIISGISKIHAHFWHPNEPTREMVGIFQGNRDTFMSEKGYSWIMEYFGFGFHFNTSLLEVMDKSKFEQHASYCEENLNILMDNFSKCMEKNKSMLEELMSDCEEGFQEVVDKIYTNDTAEIVRKSVIANTIEHDFTLIHGDYRLDNMSTKGDKLLGIFDWQTGSLGNGVFDISSFILRNLRINDVNQHEDELLKYYSEVLDIKDVDFMKVKRMYRDALAYEMIKATIWLEAFVSCKKIEQMKEIYDRHFPVFVNQLQNIFRAFCKHNEL